MQLQRRATHSFLACVALFFRLAVSEWCQCTCENGDIPMFFFDVDGPCNERDLCTASDCDNVIQFIDPNPRCAASCNGVVATPSPTASSLVPQSYSYSLST